MSTRAAGSCLIAAALAASTSACQLVSGLVDYDIRPDAGAIGSGNGGAAGGGGAGGGAGGGSGCRQGGATPPDPGPGGVVELENGLEFPTSLTTATGDPDVLFTTWGVGRLGMQTGPHGHVWRWDKGCGTLDALTPLEKIPGNVVASSDYVYWDADGNEVRRVSRAGGAPEIFADEGAEGVVAGLAADSANIYWSLPKSGTLRYRPHDGGAVDTHDLMFGYMGLHTVDASSAEEVFVLTDGSVVSAQKGGVTSKAIWLGGLSNALASDATNVYFTAADGEIWSVSKSSGEAEVLFTEQDNALNLVVERDGPDLYWTVTSSCAGIGDASVLRGSKTGMGTPEVIGVADCPAGLAMDATHVYWLDRHTYDDATSGKLKRYTKPHPSR